MLFGFSTFFFPDKPLIPLIHDIANHGVTAVELVYEAPHFDQFNEDLITHVKALRGKGMHFSLHCPFIEVNLSGYFEEVRSFSRLLTKKAIEFAAKAGCDPVVIHPGYAFLKNKVEGIENMARFYMIETLAALAADAKARGIRLGLENLQMPFFLLHDLKDFAPLKRSVPDLGLVFDVGHAYIMKRHDQAPDPEGAVLDDLLAIGVDNVIHVHLSNNSGAGDEHGFVKGKIDLKRVLRWLHNQGYQGRVIIESTEMAELGIDRVLKKIKEIDPT